MRNEFPDGFFSKPRPEATHERFDDIPMEASGEVLSGKKKLLLTTMPPDLPEATEETHEYDPKTCVMLEDEDVIMLVNHSNDECQ